MRNKFIANFLIIFLFGIITIKANKNESKKKIIKYTKIINKDRNDRWAYESRGNAYFKLKLFDRAIKDYKSAIKIKPVADYYGLLGEAYLAMGQYKKAIKKIGKALKLEDAYPYYSKRALCYDMLGQYEKAIKDYYIYLEQNDFTCEEFNFFYITCTRLAILDFNKKKYKKAMKNLKIAIKISRAPGGLFKNPNNDIYYIKFLINLKLDNFEEAKNDLLIVLRNGFNNKKRIILDIKELKKEYKIEIEKIIKSNMVKSKKLNDIDFYDKKYLVNKFLGFE